MPRSAEISITDQLLHGYQRDFPLTPEPFNAIALGLDATEREVRPAVEVLLGNGLMARIGGVVRPNTLAASTLVAVAIPALSIDSIARMIS